MKYKVLIIREVPSSRNDHMLGKFADVSRLSRGLYYSSIPKLFPFGTSMEDLIRTASTTIEFSNTYSDDIRELIINRYCDSLRCCELTEVELILH